MWWQNHLTKGLNFTAGQLVIVDEASLAGTLSLDRIAGLAQQAGAKVLLVGDYAQLQAVDAGAHFRCSRTTAPTPSNSSTSTASTSRGKSSPPRPAPWSLCCDRHLPRARPHPRRGHQDNDRRRLHGMAGRPRRRTHHRPDRRDSRASDRSQRARPRRPTHRRDPHPGSRGRAARRNPCGYRGHRHHPPQRPEDRGKQRERLGAQRRHLDHHGRARRRKPHHPQTRPLLRRRSCCLQRTSPSMSISDTPSRRTEPKASPPTPPMSWSSRPRRGRTSTSP